MVEANNLSFDEDSQDLDFSPEGFMHEILPGLWLGA